MRRVLVAVVCLCMVFCGVAIAQHKAITNQDVIDMVGLGLGDDVVIAKIQSAEATEFDTSIDGLKALKAAKVSDAVIKVVVNPKAAAAAPAAAAPASEWPEEVGVYAYVQGKLVEVMPEIVNWRSGGVLKSMATGGLTKGHVNGSIREGKSPLQTTPPVEFIIKTPEGTSVAEYQLLKLDGKSDRREFRAITGGIIHMSGGADKNLVEFKFDKVASRTFKVRVENMSKGEYGFLPPGVNSQSMASGGKIYTFGIME
jgi:hypothetical protein